MRYCIGNKMEYVDLLPALSDRVKDPADLYFTCDGHWNEQANIIGGRNNITFAREIKDMKDILIDFWNYIRQNKKWWLVPLIIIIFLVGFLLVISGSSALGPFIYSLF
jgi:hypothetical protein